MLKKYENLADLEMINGAIISTAKGQMRVKLFRDAPQTVLNFAHLAREGFYDGLNFHRVIAGFVAQGGCPNGTGTGGPGYNIPCECDGQPHEHLRGTLSMAHAGRDTGGSQFFICYSAQPHLDGVHTIFGELEDEQSLAVLDAIRQGDVIEKIEII